MNYWKPACRWPVKLFARDCSTDLGQLVTILGLHRGNSFDTIVNRQATNVHGIHNLFVSLVTAQLVLVVWMKRVSQTLVFTIKGY